jgi:glucosyl-3-phosphoglycerate synthase
VPSTYTREDFDLGRVLSLKRSHTVSVVVPAQNEAATVGAVCDVVRRSGAEGARFVDELIVVNDHSQDDTATVAQRHGARVIDLEGQSGKGEAMAAGLAASNGSMVIFLDADVTTTTSDDVLRLAQPLLEDPNIALVKPYYRRPYLDMPTGGGRVTELTARPILSLLFPGLGEVRQPLAGETAGRRELFDEVGFAGGYAVEIALLIDVLVRHGASAIAQVDLGVRRHRNRPLDELSPMATEVLRAALTRHDRSH